MADKLINQLIELDNLTLTDLLPVWDTSVSITKQVSLTNFFTFITTEIGANYQLLSAKDIADGYCGLDSSILVPTNKMGTGVAGATKFLRGDRVWNVIENLNTSVITEGVFASERLGSGTASALKFLRGDMTWAVVDATVKTINSPLNGEFARFTDPTTIEGLTKSEMLSALDLEIGTDLQAYSIKLQAITDMTPSDGVIIVGNGTTWVPEATGLARTSLGLGTISTENKGHGYVDGSYFFDAPAIKRMYENGGDLYFTDGTDTWQLNLLSSSGYVDISGTPLSGQYARFSDSDTIQGRTAAQVRSDLELSVGINVQEYSAALSTLATLTPTDSNFIVGNGTGWVVETGATVRTSLGLGTVATYDVETTMVDGSNIPTSAAIIAYGDLNWGAVGFINTFGTPEANDIARFTDVDTVEGLSYTEFKTALDLEIGVDLQAYNTNLTTLAALSPTDSNFIVGNGSAWITETGATVRTSLGLGSAAIRTAADTVVADETLPDGAAIIAYGNANWGAVGYINTSGTPEALDIAVFTDADTVTGWNSGEFLAALDLVIGEDVQAYSGKLSAIAALSVTDGNFIVGNSMTFVAETPAEARVSLGLGTAALRTVEDILTNSENIPDSAAIIAYGNANWGSEIGFISISGTPVANDYARFTDGDSVEGRSYSEVKTDLGIGTIAAAALGHGYGSGGHYYFGVAETASIYVSAGNLIYRYDDGGGWDYWTLNGAGAGDKVYEGNSSVEVIDAGTGRLEFTTDATLIGRVTSAKGLELGVNTASDPCLFSVHDGSFSANSSGGGTLLSLVHADTATQKALSWYERIYAGSITSAKTILPTCIYTETKYTGGATVKDAPINILSIIKNESLGSGDAVAIAGRAWKTGNGISDSCGVWGSAYRAIAANGGVMGLEGSIYNDANDIVAKDSLGWNAALTALENKWVVSLHLQGHSGSVSSPASPALAALAIDASSEGYQGFWNGILIDSTTFRKDNVFCSGTAGTVGINMAACRNSTDINPALPLESYGWPDIAIKLGRANTHIHSSYMALTFYDPIVARQVTLSELLSASAGGSNTQIQFNNAGALGGSSLLTWASNKLTTYDLQVAHSLTFNTGATVNGSNILASFGEARIPHITFADTQGIYTNNVDVVINNVWSGTNRFWLFQSNGNFRMNNPSPPASGGASGVTGEISIDSNYIYVRTSVGWRRVALSAF